MENKLPELLRLEMKVFSNSSLQSVTLKMRSRRRELRKKDKKKWKKGFVD